MILQVLLQTLKPNEKQSSTDYRSIKEMVASLNYQRIEFLISKKIIAILK